jgi:hypothetical protein
VGDQNAVEARLFVCLSERAYVVDVDCRTVWTVRFGYFVLLDHTDEFDAHVGSFAFGSVRRDGVGAGQRRVRACMINAGYHRVMRALNSKFR